MRMTILVMESLDLRSHNAVDRNRENNADALLRCCVDDRAEKFPLPGSNFVYICTAVNVHDLDDIREHFHRLFVLHSVDISSSYMMSFDMVETMQLLGW